MNLFFYKRFLTFILLFCFVSAYSQVLRYDDFSEGIDLQVGSVVIEHMDPEYNRIQNIAGWQSDMDNHIVRNMVSLELVRENVVGLPKFEATIEGDIRYYDENEQLTTLPLDVTVSYDPAGNVTHIDEDATVFSGGHAVEVEITAINISITSTPAILDALRLTSVIEVERYYPLDCDYIPTGLSNIPTDPSDPSNTSDVIDLRWEYIEGAVEYEVEWVYINNYAQAPLLIKNPSDLTYNFDINSTRIQTKNSFLEITDLFDRGWIVYRVRAVGRRGAEYKQRAEGAWSSAAVGTVASAPHKFEVSAHNPFINWGYQASYTEGERKFEGIGYADGLGFNRQNQARNNTENKAIVQETYYDHYGRAAVSALPVPVATPDLSYKPNFNQNLAGEHYSRADFDLDVSGADCYTPSNPMNDLSGAGQYYSPNNPDQSEQQSYIPNANGYPMARVEYLADNTGRLKSSGMAGAEYQIGTAQTVKYDYGTPYQSQLDRYFGTDVGIANRYQRNVTTDQNGQKSVSYIDPYGRVVATSLIAGSPDELIALSTNTGPALITGEIINSTTVQDVSGTGEVSYSKTFTVDIPGLVEFSYGITPESYEDNPSCFTNVCFDCQYDLHIELIDVECGDVIFTIDVPEIGFPLDITCDGPAAPYPLDPADYPELIQSALPEGTYEISKTLTVNANSIDFYTNEFLENSSCLLTYSDFYDDILMGVDFSGCGVTYCDIQCIQQIGSYTDFLADGLGSYSDYEAAIAACAATCVATTSTCDLEKARLLSDFYPGGQYATFQIGTGGVYTTTDQLSIFNTVNNLLPSNQITGNSVNWRNETYLNPDGTPSEILLTEISTGVYSPEVSDPNAVTTVSGSFVTTPDNLLHLADFIGAFQLNWAENFLGSHPEYCYYQYCLDNQTSHTYDQAMLNTDNVADAITLGYINPVDFLTANGLPVPAWEGSPNTDPYIFGGGISSTVLPDFYNLLSNVITIDGVPLSIWELAYLETYCPDASVSSDVISCIGNITTTGTGVGCFDDSYWANFRNLYLALKKQAYDESRTEWAIANGCYSGCLSPLSGVFNGALDNFTGGGICSDPLLASLYADKSPNYFSQNQNPYPNLTGIALSNAVQADISSTITSNCDDICATNAEQWMQSLIGCTTDPTTWAPGNSPYDEIYNEFVELCTLGCDASHPQGSTTAPVGSATTNGNSSIADILADYPALNYENSSCTEHLINGYTHDNSTLQEQTQSLDACACADITLTVQVYDAIIAAGVAIPGGATNIEEYHLFRTGYALDNITELGCACGDLSNNSNIQIPLGTGGCGSDVCLTCQEVTTEYNNLLADFPNLDTDANYEIILQNALNNVFGYHLSGDDYDSFLNECVGSAPSGCTPSDLGTDLFNLLETIITTAPGGIASTTPLDLAVAPYSMHFNNPSTIPNLADYGTSTGGIVYSTLETIDFGGGSLDVYIGGSGGVFGENVGCYFSMNATGAIFDWDRVTDIRNFELADFCPSTTTNQFTAEVFAQGVWYEIVVLPLTDCYPLGNCVCDAPTLCDENIFGFESNEPSCEDVLLEQVAVDAQYAYDNYIQQVSNTFQIGYVEHCLSALNTEQLNILYNDNEYHTTLFYYDQAGNLFRTVPPKGSATPFTTNITPSERENPNTIIAPTHLFETDYRYNTLNQIVETKSPDGGLSKQWYDFASRPVISQNAKQAANAEVYYSYVLYDNIGRMIEGGQVRNTSPSNITEAIVKDPTLLSAWIASGTKSEVTRSYYDRTLDASIAASFNQGQTYLRNRVSSVAYYDFSYTGSADDLNYDHATHYSYDVHGNVVEVIQDDKTLEYFGQNEKHTEYEFDLISGNTNKVKYQDGQNDAYYHEYCYDADNRLDKVSSSENDYIYDQEAHYDYYDHGPLARTEIGDWKVQGSDYAYTINGWLKAINGNTLDRDKDMGKDGVVAPYQNGYTSIHKDVAQDVYGFSLGYYEGDYSAINTTNNTFHNTLSNINTSGNYTQNLGHNLYNGNITNMATALMDHCETELDQLAAFYQYDQLHRIKSMDAYLGDTYANAQNNGAYATTYGYDANGNLDYLTRNDHLGGVMDNFDYKYNNFVNPQNGEEWNGLIRVEDNAGANLADDLGDVQPGQSGNNYTYTEIGELESDEQEGIIGIQWRWKDSKIRKIIRDNNGQRTQVEYQYDAFGRRTLKLTKPLFNGNPSTPDQWGYTYYTYDAGGNVMGVYQLQRDANNNQYEFIEKEAHLYGSSRLGLHKLDKTLATYDNVNQVATQLAPEPVRRTMGNKYYELSNHLGNVLSVITDRKLYDLGFARTLGGSPLNLDFTDPTYDPNDPLSGFTPNDLGGSCPNAQVYSIVNDALQIDYQPYTGGCSGTSARFIFKTTPGETYTVNIDAERVTNPTDIIAIETRDQINGNVITTSVYGINIQPGVTNPFIQFTFVAGSSQTRFKIFSRSDNSTDPSTLAINEISIAGTQSRVLADVISHSDYYPFGMAMDNRTESEGDYRYGFQGQEKDDEIKGKGNSISYKYRMHDARIGRFFTLDPLTAEYPHNSPYAFSENRVIDAIELEGLEAWLVKNKWNTQYIDKFNSEVEKRTQEYIKNEVKFTCEDLVLTLLIDFAKDNNLPLSFVDRGYFIYYTINQEDYDNGDFESFKADVLDNMGALDVSFNSVRIGQGKKGLEDAQKGDVILLGYGDGISHAQQVVDISGSKVNIKQGNTSKHQGLPIETGVWNTETEIYNNISREGENKFNEFDPINVYEWNFQKFNNNSISPNGKGAIYELPKPSGPPVDSSIDKYIPENFKDHTKNDDYNTTS